MLNMDELTDFDWFKNETLRNLGVLIKTLKIEYKENEKVPIVELTMWEENEDIKDKLNKVLTELDIIDDFVRLDRNIKISYYNEDLTVTTKDGREVINGDFDRDLVANLYTTIMETKEMI